MRTIVKGKNIDVRPTDRRYAEGKMRRLERILDERSDAVLEFSVEHHRSIADSRIVEATLVVDGRPLRGVAHGATHRAAVDTLVDKLERRTIALKTKPRERTRPTRSGRSAGAGRAARAAGARGAPVESAPALESPEAELAPGVALAAHPQIVKIKRFAIEPMFEEDAVARMEELGHQFFIFVNAENERLNVLYRRASGAYGVIEPVVGGAYSENGRSPWRRTTRRTASRW